jgi:sec-independent protein translocase protein TatB
MFDIGLQEMLLIGVIALLVFGPTKLPELGRMFGRAMREFRRASDEFRSTVETNLNINDLEPYPSVTPTPPTPTPGVATAEPTTLSVTGDATSAATHSSTLETLPDTASSEMTSAEEPGEPFVGQRGSRLVHRRDCGWVKRIPHGERVYWKRLVEARDQGLTNCPVCEPWEPI